MTYNGRNGTNKGKSSGKFNKRAGKTMRINKMTPATMRGGIRL